MVKKYDSSFLLWDKSDVNKVLDFFIDNKGQQFHKTQIRDLTGINNTKRVDKLGNILKKLVKYKILYVKDISSKRYYELNVRMNNRLLNRFIDFRKAFNEVHRRMHKNE